MDRNSVSSFVISAAMRWGSCAALVLLAACDHQFVEHDRSSPLTAETIDTPAAGPAAATHEALALVHRDDPEVVVTWSPGGMGVRTLAGRIHAPDPRPATEIAQSIVRDRLAEVFGLQDASMLREAEVEFTPRSGITHVRYQQTLGGYRVLDRTLTVHVATDGSIAAVNGALEPDLHPEMLDPALLDRSELERAAEEALGAPGTIELLEEPELLVSLRDDGHPVLVWRTWAIVEGTQGTVDLRIDASSGALERAHAVSMGIAATGCDIFGDSVSINTTHPIGKDFQLHDKTRPTKIRGYDQGNSTTWTTADPIDDVDNLWCEASHAAAVTGHHNLARTLDFFDDRHDRNGYDDSGSNIKIGYDAAFPTATGTTQNNAIIFPDGRLTLGFPEFSALDTIAHEFTHLVLLDEGITYGGLEAQAVHEHIADTYAVFVEEENLSSANSWNLVAAEDTYARDLANPVNIDHHSEFAPGEDQYVNSEIPSRAFALMVEGGTHPQSGVFVPVVDIIDLEAIYYEAITQYLSPGDASFLELREALAAAAGGLFGQHSSQQNSVRAAFIAVGVTPATFNLVAWADDFQIWNEWGNPVLFGSPQSSPGIGTTSAIMENDKPYDGEMFGMKPGGGGFGHVTGEFMLTLPTLSQAGSLVFAPHLHAEIGFPLIAVDTDEALVLLQLEDSSGATLVQQYIDVRRDDETVDVVDWDLEAFAGTSVTLRVMVAKTTHVPTRPVMFDRLEFTREWQ